MGTSRRKTWRDPDYGLGVEEGIAEDAEDAEDAGAEGDESVESAVNGGDGDSVYVSRKEGRKEGNREGEWGEGGEGVR